MPATSTLASAFEIVLVLAGLAAIWQTALRPEARRRSAVVRLPKWEISPINFLFFLWAIYAGGFLVQFLVYLFLKTFTSVTDDTRLILASAATDCGMLLGLKGTNFVRVAPPKVGSYACDPSYAAKLSGPVVQRAKLDANRIAQL